MKFLSILAMVFLASAPAMAKSLQDVVNTYSTVEVISPVEFNGNPVFEGAGTAICEMAGFSIKLDSVKVKKALKAGTKLVYVYGGPTFSLRTEEVVSNDSLFVLESVTCAK